MTNAAYGPIRGELFEPGHQASISELVFAMSEFSARRLRLI